MSPSLADNRHEKSPYPESKKKRSMNVWLSPGDEEMLETIKRELGVGNGEAVRTAIRVYAALLRK